MPLKRQPPTPRPTPPLPSPAHLRLHLDPSSAEITLGATARACLLFASPKFSRSYSLSAAQCTGFASGTTMIICAHRRTRSSGGSQNSSAALKGKQQQRKKHCHLTGLPIAPAVRLKLAWRRREGCSSPSEGRLYLQLVEAAHPVALHKGDALQRRSKNIL